MSFPSSWLDFISSFSALHSICPVPPVHAPVLLDFNFGAAPIEAEPSVVILMLENNGVVPVEWYVALVKLSAFLWNQSCCPRTRSCSQGTECTWHLRGSMF